MAGAWIFFATFIALFITATAQDDTEKCIKQTCGPGEACNREKCDNLNGTCIRKEDCTNRTICPGGCKYGKGKYCKYYRRCKCCMPDICTPRCNTDNGMCMFGECKCEPGWDQPTCDEFSCNPACVNGNCTGPNECTCNPGWRGPACNESYCDPECVNGDCTGPNECTCDPGWGGPTCNEFYCDPECQNGGTCVGPNDCACTAAWGGDTCAEFFCDPECQNGGTCIGPNDCACTPDWEGPTCGTPAFECKNAKKCNDANGVCYHQSDPILQNITACPNTIKGKYCNSKECRCCYE